MFLASVVRSDALNQVRQGIPAGMAADSVGVICRFSGKGLCNLQRCWGVDFVDVTAKEDVLCFAFRTGFAPVLTNGAHLRFGTDR